MAVKERRGKKNPIFFNELSFPVSKKSANSWVKYTTVLVKAPRVLTQKEKQKAVAKRNRGTPAPHLGEDTGHVWRV